jgi:hypothetical protein
MAGLLRETQAARKLVKHYVNPFLHVASTSGGTMKTLIHRTPAQCSKLVDELRVSVTAMVVIFGENRDSKSKAPPCSFLLGLGS